MTTRKAGFALALIVALSMARSATAQVLKIPGVTPRPVAEGQARGVRHMDPAQMLRLSLVLQPRDQEDLQRFLRDVQDPASPRFHRFLTFDEWKARYAPSNADVAKVGAWARQSGLTVIHQFRNNLALKVEANAATVEQTFGVQLNHYELGARRFFSNDHDPTMPPELTGILKDVQGLNSYARVLAAHQSANVNSDDEPIYKGGPFIREETAARSGHGRGKPGNRADAPQNLAASSQGSISGGFDGLEYTDFYSSEAYDVTTLQWFSECCNPTHNPSGSPKETSIAIIGQNSIALSDLQTFTTTYGLAFNLTQVMINGPSCCNEEMTLDIESATAMANSFSDSLDTAHVYAYEGGGTLISDQLDAWQQAHSSDSARTASTSFGAYEEYYGGLVNPSISDFSDVINAMSAQGWSLAAASGDHGAYDDCNSLSVNFPASNPLVVAVGGTTLSLTNNAGQPKFGSETAWTGDGCGGSSWPGSNHGGGGGGCSNTEPKGWWQSLTVGCGTKRAVPDIALNSGTGVRIYYASAWENLRGTSAASPEFAGFLAHANSYLLRLGNICSWTHDKPCAPLGNPNVPIWFEGGFNSTTGGRNPFYDITTGCNAGSAGTGYCTTPGYDLATGWGSVNWFQLAWVINSYLLAPGALNPVIAFTGPATNGWYNSNKHVDFSITSPPFSGTNASVGVAGYGAQWDASVAEVLTHATPGSGDVFYDGPPKLGSSDFLSLAAAGLGCHTAHVRAWDNIGDSSGDKTYGPICYDNIPPIVSCGSSDGLWHANDVSIPCISLDADAGLANAADASFSLTTSVAAGTETNNAFTNSRLVCDAAGNCVTGGPIGGNGVDKKPPSIAITVPVATQYVVKQPVSANYGCADGGSGLATCVGPVASGSAIDTASIGTKTFTVNATDNVANAGAQSVSYDVTYRICLRYDPNKATSGRAENISLQLCDYNGANVSMASIKLTATAVDGNPVKAKPLGSLNPGNVFLYGPGSAPGASYLYVLDTQGLGAGLHILSFTVQGDPVVHSAPFTLKK